METVLILLTKPKEGEYSALFEGGNGGAWNDWYVLFKRTNSDEEALEWAQNLHLGNKWAPQYQCDILTALDKIGWDISGYQSPELAGSDYCIYKPKSFVVDGGFEIALGCAVDGIKGANLSFNVGTRNYPRYEEQFIEFRCNYIYTISFGAGRSSKQTIYLDDRGFKGEKILFKSNLGEMS